MATLLSSILQSVGAKVDQDTTLPSGTELTVRVNYADQSQEDWKDAYSWKALKKTYPVTVLNSMTSIGLPALFDRFSSPVYDYSTGVDSPTRYTEIRPEERFSKASTDKYVYTMGDEAAGKYLIINPALVSGASIVFDYQSLPSSLATVTDTVTCPNIRFMTERISFYILEARSDARLPSVEARSNDILAAMIEKENTPTGGEDNRVPDFQRSNNFRVGRD